MSTHKVEFIRNKTQHVNVAGLVKESEALVAEMGTERGREVSPTLASLLLVEDWFIWTRDGNRVRRYVHECSPVWLDNPIDDGVKGVDEPRGLIQLSNVWMIQHLENFDWQYEKRDNGEYITPEQFLRADFGTSEVR